MGNLLPCRNLYSDVSFFIGFHSFVIDFISFIDLIGFDDCFVDLVS